MTFKLRSVVALVAFALLPSLAQAENADSIVEKCLASYDSLKSYQATITMIESAPAKGSATMTMRVKADTHNGIVQRKAVSMSTTLKGQQGTQTQVVQIVDDGAQSYIIFPAKKEYTTKPHLKEKMSSVYRETFAKIKQNGIQFTVSKITKNGKPCYALQGKAPAGTISIFVDKATYHLKSISAKSNVGQIQQVISQETFNAAIPAETFHWSPPAGYKRLTPALQPAQPGSPPRR